MHRQDTHHMYIAIMAGGVGTRLWPRSRQSQPKQFSDIHGAGRTMIQATVDRLDGLVEPDRIYVVTGARYRGLAHRQLPQIPRAQILAEPCGRNTAPAIALACLHLRRRDPDAVLVSLHSDHIIASAEIFQAAICRAVELAHNQDYIVTLGIEPTFPHTGYGYIQRVPGALDPANIETERCDGEMYPQAFGVEQFLEKPDRATAEALLRAGGYYWNAGMFICRAQRMLDEIQARLPKLYAGLQEIERSLAQSPEEAQTTLDCVWPTLPDISIDHGVMESASRVAVVPLATAWNDVGSWDALEAILPANADGNIIAGGEVVALDSSQNIVYTSADKLVALIGVENLVIVDTGDAILVGPKQQMQRVKEVVDTLQKTDRDHRL
jgi:mannose-1-phosphate guanylyltransferase